MCVFLNKIMSVVDVMYCSHCLLTLVRYLYGEWTIPRLCSGNCIYTLNSLNKTLLSYTHKLAYLSLPRSSTTRLPTQEDTRYWRRGSTRTFVEKFIKIGAGRTSSSNHEVTINHVERKVRRLAITCPPPQFELCKQFRFLYEFGLRYF